MTSFSRFQERNKKRTVAKEKLNARFVFQGYPATTIAGENDVTVQAAVVNQQEKDKAYVYTASDTPLKIGSVWRVKGLSLLITDKIVNIKDVYFNKYVALNCNIEVNGTAGFFRGPEKSFIGVTLSNSVVWNSNQKPVLVLPAQVLDFQDKIVIKDRAWMVQEYDAISTDGIVYYSLIPATVSKEVAAENTEKDVYIEKHISQEVDLSEEVEGVTTINNNTPVSLPTEDGYFKTSNRNIKIIKRTSQEIVFMLPFGVSSVEIQTKQKGQYVTTAYRAL